MILPNWFKQLVIVLVCLLAIFAAACILIPYLKKLDMPPSDEAMIEHFYAHKNEIEEVVRRYREYPGPIQDHARWSSVPETALLMRQASIRDVGYVSPLFFPDPYSYESAQRIKAAERKDSYMTLIKYGVVRVVLDGDGYFKASFRYGGLLLKDIYFFPEMPKIENGWLMVPDSSGVAKKFALVADSLNHPPKDFECLLKMIESHWFLSICWTGYGKS